MEAVWGLVKAKEAVWGLKEHVWGLYESYWGLVEDVWGGGLKERAIGGKRRQCGG